jgi:hypothetical protein
VVGPVWPTPFKEPVLWDDFGPTRLGLAQLARPAHPTYLILYNIYYVIILFKKKTKTKIQNFFLKK